MVDIQSATAEIRQGKKKEGRKKPHDKNIMAPLLHRAAIINCTVLVPKLKLWYIHFRCLQMLSWQVLTVRHSVRKFS